MRLEKDAAYKKLESESETKREMYERRIDELELIISSKSPISLNSYRTFHDHKDPRDHNH
jgi:hypothetical protein